MSDDLTEKKINSKLVYEGRLLRVFKDEVELPDGERASREYIKHPGASVIVPIFSDDAVLIEYQFRYAIDSEVIELPAGKLDYGEEPIDTARRELLEETGYSASHWEELGTLLPCIGYSNERIHAFLARDLRFSGQKLDDGEFIKTDRVPLKTLVDWAHEGRISDAKSIIALLWAKNILDK